MQIDCLHGYFQFREQRAGEISDFCSLFGMKMVRKQDYFTFAQLDNVPDYTIKGAPLLNATAIATVEGLPWEIFKANKLIYDYDSGFLRPITSVTRVLNIYNVGRYYVFSPGLVLPGSLTDGGQRVRDYAAWFSTDTMKFRFSEVTAI